MAEFRAPSIRRKLFQGMLLTTLFALVLSSVALIAYDLRDYHRRLLQDLITQSKVIGLSVIPALEFSDKRLAKQGLSVLSSRPNVQTAAIYDANGQLFAAFQRNGEKGPAIPQTPNHTQGYFIENNFIHIFQDIRQNSDVIGTIYIAANYRIKDRLWQYAGFVFALMLLALVLSMFVSIRIQKRVSEPILKITSIARRVTESRDYSLRTEKLSNDEVGYLADAFNDLLAEVESRSSALEQANIQLQQEIVERKQANEKVQHLNQQLEQKVAERTAELKHAYQELESFSYSVSHDLRAPLRAIDGFSEALLEDYLGKLDEDGQDYLKRVRTAAQRMGQLIDDLLKLAKVSRAPISRDTIDLSAMVETSLQELREREPHREVLTKVESGVSVQGDPRLMQIVMENLLSNAWKYTGERKDARIEFGTETTKQGRAYFVCDNGAGFDMKYADKLFGAFQRLHDVKAFPGTGVGLATVQRVIHRHGGKIWANAAVDEGATFYFTLPAGE